MVNAPITVFIDSISPSDLPLIGEKAHRIATLMKAGFPIPSGFVVTADAWRRCVAESNLWPEISLLLEKIGELDEESFRRRADKIRQVITSCAIPENILSEINNAYVDLGGGNHFAEVAVRSSAAPVIEGKAVPFGIFDSFFFIQGIEPVILAIKHVWAGTFSDRALRYLSRAGHIHKTFPMAVIVQSIIPTDAGGKIFTCDPATGSKRKIIIHASSASVITEEEKHSNYEIFVVNCAAWELDERRAEGGKLSGLSESAALSLAKFGKRIEERFECPQEIDWRLHDGNFHITDSKPLASRIIRGDDTAWSRFLFAEFLPNVMTPFTRSVLLPPFEKALRHSLFDDKNVSEGVTFSGDIAGRIYMNSGLIRDRMPQWLKSYPQLMPDACIAAERDENSSRPNFADCISMLIRAGWYLRKLRLKANKIIVETENEREDFSLSDLRGKSDAALHIVFDTFWETTLEPIALIIIESYFASLRLHAALRSVIRYCRLENQDATHAAMSLIEESSKLPMDIWKLSRLADSIGHIAERLPEISNWKELDSYLDRIEGGGLFRRRLNAFLKIHGHRSAGGFEAAQPRWKEDPLEILTILTMLIRMGEAIDPSARLERAAAKSREIERSVNKTSGFVSYNLFKISKKWAATADDVGCKIVDYFEKSIDMLRHLALEAGRRLKNRKEIENETDIFYLTIDEIRRVLALELLPDKISDVVKSRKEDYKNLSEIGHIPAVMSDWSKSSIGLDRDRYQSERKFEGIAVSNGSYTGSARVLIDFEDVLKLRPGEAAVLAQVPKTYCSIISAAGALIIEAGGFISAGAEAARSFGVPCVAAVRDICNYVQDGDIIMIDGSAGKIIIKQQKAPEAEVTAENPTS